MTIVVIYVIMGSATAFVVMCALLSDECDLRGDTDLFTLLAFCTMSILFGAIWPVVVLGALVGLPAWLAWRVFPGKEEKP